MFKTVNEEKAWAWVKKIDQMVIMMKDLRKKENEEGKDFHIKKEAPTIS